MASRKPREWHIVFFDDRGPEVFCSRGEAENEHGLGHNPHIIRVREVKTKKRSKRNAK